ncbi:hypothetical protein [Rhizobium sp. CCGE 510]|uniref:hypothetical protein n=1 Tax=Rhizobium sp. CCGE 510 TaxID=1132836 RepID=UPI00027B7E77|nr:hypothetical protein [Rhizobium sp. CCGE 510]EJT04951.1 hypothetical protein RCCGE510_12486 [Rhizobium sp. CCGE 510]
MANTFKFSTILWVAAGLLIPLWPVSLPVCWFFAYRSYRDGGAPTPSLPDLQAAAELHKSGNLSDAEFQKIKSQALGTRG